MYKVKLDHEKLAKSHVKVFYIVKGSVVQAYLKSFFNSIILK